MILYFPYTFIPDHRLRRLCEQFDRFSVLHTSDHLISDGMRRLANERKLDIRLPGAVDGDRLRAVLDDFNAWAAMHPRGIDDFKGFFRTYQNQPPLVEETHPNQIRTQVRHFGEPADTGAKDDPRFQAALFLSLAHHFDAYQNGLSTELGAVRRMEKQMFNRLSGENAIDNTQGPGFSRVSSQTTPGEFSPGESEGHLITERLRSWAVLAADDPEPPWALVTTDREAMAVLREVFPESTGLGHWYLGSAERVVTGPFSPCTDMMQKIEAWAFNETYPEPQELDITKIISHDGPDDPLMEDCRFFLFGVSHCSPRQALHRLISIKGRPAMEALSSSSPRMPVNTLFGLITGF